MKKSNEIFDDIEELEQERVQLLTKQKRTLPFYFIFPLVAFVAAALALKTVVAASILLIASTTISTLAYYLNLQDPFKKLASKVKAALLSHFMELYHPTIRYNYSPNKKGVKAIVRNSGLISADVYKEEDVIQGKMNDVSFYISEINLKNESKDSSHSIFKGILFKLKIPGKSFPTAQIQSRSNLLKRLFRNFKQNEEFGFWYESQDDAAFHDKLNAIFPFIRHLIKHQGDVRISTKGDELTLLLSSEMKFLDDPKPSLDRSFLLEEYHAKLGKQLNSLLFIADAISSDLSSNQIEEQLELKELRLADSKQRGERRIRN